MTLSPTPDSPATSLSFAEWLSGVLLRWRTILWCVALTFVVAGLAVIIIAPRYEAEASFMVNGASAKSTSIGGGAGLSGIAGQLGLGGGEQSESPPFYKELLESRELLTRLLESRFPDPRTASAKDSVPLLELINVHRRDPRDRMERAVKKIKKRVTAEVNVKTPLVRIYASTAWPELSAQVANRAMALVDRFNHEQRASRAHAKRQYLQQRMDSAARRLVMAEGRRRDFLAGNRKIDFSPSLQLSDEQLKHEIDQARDDYQSLQKQVDAAELDELNDAPLITIVDSAIPPARPTWPRAEWVITGALLIGLIIGIVLTGTMTVYATWGERNPVAAARLSNAWNDALLGITPWRRRRTPVVGA